MNASGEPRFLADAMLGRLARWLRTLGYDTAYMADTEDGALVLRAERERRLLLTRDRGLLERWHPRSALFVAGDRGLDQLRQVVTELHLDPAARAPRCRVCNGELESLSPEAARDAVPPYVHHTQERFHRCAVCGRTYWEGTHTLRMREAMKRALAS